VRRVDGGGDRRDDRGRQPVREPPQPPRRADAGDAEAAGDDARGQVRRRVVPRLERRLHVHDERRPLEPARIRPAAVRHPPRARDDVQLVRVEQPAERQPVPEPDEPQDGRARDDHPK